MNYTETRVTEHFLFMLWWPQILEILGKSSQNVYLLMFKRAIHGDESMFDMLFRGHTSYTYQTLACLTIHSVVSSVTLTIYTTT